MLPKEGRVAQADSLHESQRDSDPKPRVARNELPWVTGRHTHFTTATRLRQFRSPGGAISCRLLHNQNSVTMLLVEGHQSLSRVAHEAAALDVRECVTRVRGGDEAAARDLLAHLHPLVLKLVRAHLPRRTSE